MKNVLSATYGSCKYILYSIYIFIVICPVYFFFIAHLLIFNKKNVTFVPITEQTRNSREQLRLGVTNVFFLIHFSILETYNKCRSNKLLKRF